MAPQPHDRRGVSQTTSSAVAILLTVETDTNPKREVAKSLPRLRFGLVWIGTISTADSIASPVDRWIQVSILRFNPAEATSDRSILLIPMYHQYT